MVHIEESYLASGGVYGSRNVHRDLTEAGEHIGRKRVERLMHQHGLRSVRSQLRRRYKGGSRLSAHLIGCNVSLRRTA